MKWMAGMVGLALMAGAATAQQIATKKEILAATADLALGPENGLQSLGNLLAWSTRDSLHFAALDWIYPVTLCASPEAVFHRLPSIALPGSRLTAPPAFRLAAETSLADAGMEAKVAVVALILPDGKLHRYSLLLPREDSPVWVAQHDSLSLSLKPGQVPAVVALQRDPLSPKDAYIFIGGTGALFRIVQWRGKLSGGAMDQTSQAEPTAYGEGLFGGSTGGSFTWNYPGPPEYLSSGMPGPVLQIDATAALGDAGWVSVHEGSGWNAFHLQTPPGDYRMYRGFVIVRDERGLGILRYPKTGEPRYDLLRETPSGLGQVKRNGVAYAGVPTTLAYHRDDVPTLFETTFADLEGNYTPPAMDWVRPGADTVHLARGFTASLPEGGCAGPGLCVQDGAETLKIDIRQDSLILTMKMKATSYAGVPVPCAPVSRRDSLFVASHSWKRGDAIEIREGGSRFRIIYDTPDAIRIRYPAASAPSGSGFVLRDAAGRTVGMDAPGGKGKISVATYRLR